MRIPTTTLRVLPVLLTTALAGCPEATFLDPYYPNFRAPSFDAFDVASEAGNLGGQTITLTGSGFGADPLDVIVLFQNHNAEIVSVTDTSITLITPPGPLTGGPVDVVIATGRGYLEIEDAYTYDTGTLSGDPAFYENERYYVLVQNYWQSCLGGGGPAGCETVSYFGDTGLDGRAEFFRPAAIYPRIQTAYQGFVTGADHSPSQWTVQEGFEPPFPSGVDDLRLRVGSFTMRNPANADEGYCYDLTGLPSDGESSCSGNDVRRYDLGTLQFCEGEDAETGGDFTYIADWPVLEDFFESNSAFGEVEVRLDIPEIGLVDEPLTLPPELLMSPSVGIEGDYIDWANGVFSACGDGNGDGEATLDESGLTLSWEPIDDSVVLGGGDTVLGVDTYVLVSVSRLELGWFGGESWSLRASIVVPDDNDFDAGTGLASVEIPNEVLYQFPTPNLMWSGESQISGTGYLGTFDSGASYMLIEIQRVTDYRIQTDDGILVLSYVTGDLTFPQFINPAEAADDCSDCLDGDGDGWTDAFDPDCQDGTTEANATSSFTCNDGLDNDDNGDIDADDEKCASGMGGETNCGDGVDNDGDGWVDGLDGECDGDPFAQELGDDDPSWTCSDGVDSDGDGWVDALDPVCATGSDVEDDGFGTNACNDGIDNDGNGDPDALDPYCGVVGGGGTSEAPPAYITQCVDNNDNDADGYRDARDPDCEYPPHSRETQQFHDPVERPLTPTCYDGLDNDGDGAIDADDPSCWDGANGYVPDGFRGESTVTSDDCTDNLDGDSDGWIDGRDPDCRPNDPTHQTETGFGTTQCNDGIDNNGDDLIDSESPYCNKGSDNFEGPN